MTSRGRPHSPLSIVLTRAIALVIAVTLGHPGATLAQEVDGYPARIHEGTCDAIGPVTAHLTGVGAAIDLEGTPMPVPEVVGTEAVFPIAMSTTTLEISMADLVETPHAIVVSASDEAMETPLVCGTVGGALMRQMPGMPMPGDELVIWLAPHDDSAYTGLALQESQGQDRSGLTIFLLPRGGSG